MIQTRAASAKGVLNLAFNVSMSIHASSVLYQPSSIRVFVVHATVQTVSNAMVGDSRIAFSAREAHFWLLGHALNVKKERRTIQYQVNALAVTQIVMSAWGVRSASNAERVFYKAVFANHALQSMVLISRNFLIPRIAQRNAGQDMTF